MIRILNRQKINTPLKRKVFVAMSGGVDSSVAAGLLKEQGYDVTGVFMKNWADSSFFKDKTMCPWVEDQEDARKAAAVLDIPFYTFNFEKEYRSKVVRYMTDGYKRGITPNPDVMCNKEIKFGLFLKKALALGADYIATGHYARCEQEITNHKTQKPNKSENQNCKLLAGVDKNKDQSYFLYLLGQKELARTLFPIGEYTKPEVRAMARKFGLSNAEKKDSQGLCFVGEVDVHEFLKSKIKPKKGKIITTNGKEVGEHEGASFYTIGQRHGIGSPGGGIPYYVVGKDIKKNILYVAEGKSDERLYKKELVATDIHWISGKEPKFPLDCEARIRYRQPIQKATLFEVKSQKSKVGSVKVVFDNPQRAVTPGQSIVFYGSPAGATVLGGGVISKL